MAIVKLRSVCFGITTLITPVTVVDRCDGSSRPH
jgi:hypothetical protein